MKKIYLLALALVFAGAYNAQAQLKLGLKGGLNFPSLNEQNGNYALENNTGWHGGVMVEVKLPVIGIEGDIIYSQVGHVADFSDINPDWQGDVKTTTLDIPILAKLYLFKILTIQAGPQFSFITSSKINDIDWKSDLESNNFRIVAGLGVQLGPIDVHGRFILPSTTKINGSTVAEVKNSNIQLSVGFWLKK